ncbi:MAG: restriction endonuclease subunit S, partial [Verrucomicrobiota bacterium]|nr:restriction endonuclease subunit S [Verrucomicrobiota bacterium]
MKHWPTKPLGQLVTIEKGKKAPEAFAVTTRTSLRYLQIEDLRVNTTMKYCEPFACPRATKSDVIIAWDGANAGTVSCNLDGHIGSTLALLRPIAATTLSAPFLSRFLGANFDYLQKTATGATIPHVSKGALTALQIPVPPLAEQERIVKLLDEADELRKLRAQADQRTANLISALFHEMFGNPVANSKGWPQHKLPDLCEGKEGIKAGPFGSSLKKECYTSEGPRVYGQEQVIAGDFSIGNYHISEAKFSEMSAYVVRSEDLLISLVGTIGKVIVVPDGIERGIINPRLLRVRPRTELLHPCYLAHVLTSPSIIQFLGGIATGITMGVLNAGILKQLVVPLPPLALQKEFAQRVNEIRELEAEQVASRTRLDALFQSMLHRAFNG